MNLERVSTHLAAGLSLTLWLACGEAIEPGESGLPDTTAPAGQRSGFAPGDYQIVVINPMPHEMSVRVERDGQMFSLGTVPAQGEQGFPPIAPQGVPLTIVASAPDGSEIRGTITIDPETRPLVWRIEP